MSDLEIITKQQPTGRHEYFSLYIYLLACLFAYVFNIFAQPLLPALVHRRRVQTVNLCS